MPSKNKKILIFIAVLVIAVFAGVTAFGYINYAAGNRIKIREDKCLYYANLLRIDVDGDVTDDRLAEIELITRGKCDDISTDAVTKYTNVYVLLPQIHTIEGIWRIGDRVLEKTSYAVYAEYVSAYDQKDKTGIFPFKTRNGEYVW